MMIGLDLEMNIEYQGYDRDHWKTKVKGCNVDDSTSDLFAGLRKQTTTSIADDARSSVCMKHNSVAISSAAISTNTYKMPILYQLSSIDNAGEVLPINQSHASQPAARFTRVVRDAYCSRSVPLELRTA